MWANRYHTNYMAGVLYLSKRLLVFIYEHDPQSMGVFNYLRINTYLIRKYYGSNRPY